MKHFTIKLTLQKKYCGTEEFEINGVVAYADDFVDKEDENPGDADDYGCGNMVARVIKHTEEVLTKYNIDETEYNRIAEELSEGLSFGYCNGCY